jgi:hypothetical protein
MDIMKKLMFLLLLCVGLFTTQNVEAQMISEFDTFADYEKSQWDWGGTDHKFTMNYTMFGKNYMRGVWYGSLGYATGMYLSNNRTGWGIVGSMLAVNIPILLDEDYDKEELWIGQNLGALTISMGLTFSIEMHRNGKANWQLKPIFRKP